MGCRGAVPKPSPWPKMNRRSTGTRFQTSFYFAIVVVVIVVIVFIVIII